MVTERGLQVLRVIVQDYVAHREPVGSKSIVERHAFGVSAATIRNEMAQLEEEGLRTPPPGAYRPTRATASSSTVSPICARSPRRSARPSRPSSGRAPISTRCW
jgi:predicted transcriptional regulator